MTYFVVDPSGTSYGPADEILLRQWVQEGRVQPGTTIRDANGQTMVALAVPGLFPDGTQYVPPTFPQNAPYYPRPANYNSQDLTIAWICAIAGVLCCGLVGIGGVIMSKRVLDQGNEAGRAPLIVSWFGIGLQVIGLVVWILSNPFAG